jgi:hypothetical protein
MATSDFGLDSRQDFFAFPGGIINLTSGGIWLGVRIFGESTPIARVLTCVYG